MYSLSTTVLVSVAQLTAYTTPEKIGKINKQRQREGIELAKAAGKYKGRKPIEIDEQLFRSVYKNVREGKCTNTYAMKVLGLKSSTYYRTVKRLFNG